MSEHHEEFHTLTKPYGPCTPTCPHPDHQQTGETEGLANLKPGTLFAPRRPGCNVDPVDQGATT